MRPRCICGCDERVAAQHHVVYKQELKRVASERGDGRRPGGWPGGSWKTLVNDPRNLVHVAFDCHGAHHLRAKPYRLVMLPDSVFEFAAEVLGPGKAFNYLRRRYDGKDERLDALLDGPVGAVAWDPWES